MITIWQIWKSVLFQVQIQIGLYYGHDYINIAHFLFFKNQIMQNEWHMVQNNHFFLVDWIVLVQKSYSLELCIHRAKFSIWSTVTVFSFIYEYIGYSQIHFKIQIVSNYLKPFYVSCYQLFLYWGFRFIFKITKISSAVFSFGTKIGTNRFNYVILQIASGQVSLPKFAFVTIFSSVWHLSSPIVQLYLEFLNLLFSKIFAMDQIIMMKLILFDPLENDVEIGISA